MNNLFVYLELLEDSRVAEVSLELLTKGRSLATQLGCRLEAVAAGCGLEGIAAQVMPYGVDVLHLFDAEGLYPYTSLPHTSVLVGLFKEEQPQIALMGATVIGLNDLNICLFVVTANIIDLTIPAMLQYGINCSTMVPDMKPIADLHTVTIDR